MYIYIFFVTTNFLFKFLGLILVLICARIVCKIEGSMCTSLALRIEHLIVYKMLANYHFDQYYIIICILRIHDAIPML